MKNIVLPCLVVAMLVVFVGPAPTAGADDPSPNPLFIFSDDQSFRTVSCYPGAYNFANMPNIDHLAEMEATLPTETSSFPHGPKGELFSDGEVRPEALGSEGGNFAFLDGSVSFVRQNRLIEHSSSADGNVSGYWPNKDEE